MIALSSTSIRCQYASSTAHMERRKVPCDVCCAGGKYYPLIYSVSRYTCTHRHTQTHLNSGTGKLWKDNSQVTVLSREGLTYSQVRTGKGLVMFPTGSGEHGALLSYQCFWKKIYSSPECYLIMIPPLHQIHSLAEVIRQRWGEDADGITISPSVDLHPLLPRAPHALCNKVASLAKIFEQKTRFELSVTQFSQ